MRRRPPRATRTDTLVPYTTLFRSTDTEVIAHLIHDLVRDGSDLTTAVQRAVRRLKGAYAIVVFDAQRPDRLCVARIASPLVLGLGDHGENFVASDVQALLPIPRRFQFLDEGDVAEVRPRSVARREGQEGVR